MKSVLSQLAVLVSLGVVIAVGCKTMKPASVAKSASHPNETPTPSRPQITRVDYVDSDAFDLLFESALLTTQPVIVVQTEFDKPEWGARLNDWIAAWNSGRRTAGVKSRGQLPPVPTVVVDADSIREFRILIDGLMSRVEESARQGGHWWAERQIRERRITLLRGYNLRFHLDANGHIQLIFYHGDYATFYQEVVRSLADPVGEESMEWSPGYCCSHTRVPSKKSARGN